MDQGRTVKKIFASKPNRSSRKGRTRLRWLEDVEEGLPEMKVKRWRQEAIHKEKLPSIITEAKTLRGP